MFASLIQSIQQWKDYDVTKVFEGYVTSGKEFPDALSICCTLFYFSRLKGWTSPTQVFPNSDEVPVLQHEWGIKHEEENQNQGGNDGSGKVLTKGRMWEENEVEEFSEHTLIGVLSSKTSLTK